MILRNVGVLSKYTMPHFTIIDHRENIKYNMDDVFGPVSSPMTYYQSCDVCVLPFGACEMASHLASQCSNIVVTNTKAMLPYCGWMAAMLPLHKRNNLSSRKISLFLTTKS
jgi:hypothetical protein